MPKRRKNVVVTPWVEETKRESLSFIEAKQLFLSDIRGLAKQTQRWHRENLTAFEKVLAKQNICVDDVSLLTPRLVRQNFTFYMLETMQLKPNTINGRIRSVRALVQYLFREGCLSSDFSGELDLVKGERVLIQTFSEEQIQALLAAPDRHTYTGLRDYTLMLLLMETGIRIAECINIRCSDIRHKEGQILIHGKGAKQRLVPFQQQFRKALKTYLEARGIVDTDALFLTVDGTPISKRYVQELIQQYGKQAKLTGVRVSPHTFRHTMAKYYILAGGDVFSLQHILGHSSLETVRLYVDLFSHDVHSQHRKFSFLEHYRPDQKW